MTDTFKERASKEIEGLRGRLIEISMAIHDEPELGYEEYKASELLATKLEKFGFCVERAKFPLSCLPHVARSPIR